MVSFAAELSISIQHPRKFSRIAGLLSGDRFEGKSFGDGSHILYVNGMYRDSTEIGKLMHDFSCPNPADMYYKVLAERASFLKEKEEGVTEMCKIMDEMMREAVQEKCYELAIEMIKDNDMTDDKIIKYTGMTLEEIQELREELAKELQEQ